MGNTLKTSEFKNIVTLLKALSNENRLHILYTLSDGEKSVSEILSQVSLSQSALSQHLARLRQDKLVKTRRDAQMIYYSITHNKAQSLLAFIKQLT